MAQTYSQVVTQCVFLVSMALCCLMGLLGSGFFRRRFFTRYRIEEQEYRRLGRVIGQLSQCQNLIINIQDNELSQQKMNILL